jgi:hypothetical protein
MRSVRHLHVMSLPASLRDENSIDERILIRKTTFDVIRLSRMRRVDEYRQTFSRFETIDRKNAAHPNS